MSGFTQGPWKLILHGNETYPFPLSIHTKDDDCWIARGGEVSSLENARLIAAAPALLEALEATQWGFMHSRCPVCSGFDGETENDHQHNNICIVGRALTATKQDKGGE